MLRKEAILRELPYLRRYTRSITGTQARGDAAVRDLLEALLAAPEQFSGDANPRQELFRILHKGWQPGGSPQPDKHAPTASLGAQARQALILTTVEGFTSAEAAAILDLPENVVEQELVAARATINGLLKADIMIIEDEVIIALHIQAVVSDDGHRVVTIARTHDEAVKGARVYSPELVLADINLADGSNGVDAIDEILDEIDVPVIFVTAYPERLLTGERPEPTYLITKPFNSEVLQATIAQALMYHREAAGRARMAAA